MQGTKLTHESLGIAKKIYFCSRSGDLMYWESSEGFRSRVSPMLVALRMPAGGKRSGLVPSAECKQDWCLVLVFRNTVNIYFYISKALSCTSKSRLA